MGKLGRTKKIAFGARWERGREKRVLCHMMCGSVVLAKPADYLDAFERCCEDNSIKGVSILFHGFFTIHVFGAVVRHSIVPRALSIFSITAILIGIPSGSLCEGERSDVPFVRLGGHRAPNYGILDSAPIPQGLCFHWDNFDPILTT